MKGFNNYKGETGELVLISGPNCDNEQGYVYGEYTILWQDKNFILYGSEGNWPNLNKKEHVSIKKRITKDSIHETYVRMFGLSAFLIIENAIDEDGWFCTEKCDRWLQIEPHNMKLLQFRNDYKDFRPRAFSE